MRPEQARTAKACTGPEGKVKPPTGGNFSDLMLVQEKQRLLRYDTIGRIELIPSIVLSSNNTNCKNDIQLFLQLFDELSVYRDYH